MNILSGIFECQSLLTDRIDTIAINKQTTEALAVARQMPDVSIIMAHQALLNSRRINYKKGIADACLSLGSAWLAKYNAGDSARYYNMKAFDLFTGLNDSRGKARACYGLSYVFSFKGDLSESERFAALSLNYFDQSGDKRGMINAYNVLSYLAKQQKDLRKARALIEQAVDIARSVKDTLPLADVTNSLGNIYKDMALFNKAIDTYFEALNLWEAIGDSAGISIAYGSIGLMYYYQKEWKKALEFNFRKLPLSEAAGDLWELSKTYNTIAQIYNSKDEHDSALIYLRKGLWLNNRMNYTSGIAASHHKIASTYLLLYDTDSAFRHINRAVVIASGIKDPSLVEYYITLGNTYQLLKDYSSALWYALKAYNQGKEKNLPLVVSDATRLLSDIYEKSGRRDIAYNYIKEYQQLTDSISNDDYLKQVTRLEIQYEYEKKQKAAEFAQMKERLISDNKIRQQNLYLKGLAILVLFVVLISLLLIRHNRLRSKYASIDLEQRLLRAQMNPHFIFNSLCTVQDFILSGKPQEANTFLTKIARLMRNILEYSREEFITLEKEIETARLYLDLQQLRFDTKFDYHISIDDAIDPGNISIPPMLTQPFIENSIEHGLLPLKGKGNLKVTYSLSNGLVKLEVTDNGIGRKSAAGAAAHRDRKPVSTKVTTERLANFRKRLRQKKIDCEITDLYEEGKPSGTKVVILLPYKKIYI